MNYRKTSVDTYREISDNGLLSKKRALVYNLIYEHGPINCRQIILRASGGHVTNTGAISGRLSELEDRGVIYSAYEGECPTTGHKTIFWATTDKLPKEPEKRKSCGQKMKELKAKYDLMRVAFTELAHSEMCGTECWCDKYVARAVGEEE